jgi:ubiquinone/menaquinone biosynthesis C-methylase UbiE
MLPDYDFDIHKPLSFMYYFTKQYMDQTYRVLLPMKSLKGKTLWDIGIGRGRSLTLFKALGIQKVVGFDVNESETQYADEQSKRLELDVQVIIDSAHNEKLKKIPDNSCDAVSLMNILFCAQDNIARKTLVDEVKRILKIDGILIVVDMQKYSLMWLFSFLSRKPWKFGNQNELIELMAPLLLISSADSNHFYFINSFVDILSKWIGHNICFKLNSLFKALRIPPSTRTFVFTKK